MDLKIIRDKLVGNDQERAVSPVIGVILMVAITVILAAVIAAFVLDMGDSMGDSGPTVATDASTNSGWDNTTASDPLAYVSHTSGDSVEMADVEIIIRNEDGQNIETFDNTGWNKTDAEIQLGGSTPSGDDEFGGGAQITLITDDGDDLGIGQGEDFSVHFVHTESDTTFAEHELSAP